MAEIRSHRVTVLGREFQVKSPASPERVGEVERLVNARLADVAPMVTGGDTVTVASLALLNLAEEYLALSEERDRLCSQGSEQLSRLIRLVDGELS